MATKNLYDTQKAHIWTFQIMEISGKWPFLRNFQIWVGEFMCLICVIKQKYFFETTLWYLAPLSVKIFDVHPSGTESGHNMSDIPLIFEISNYKWPNICALWVPSHIIKSP